MSKLTCYECDAEAVDLSPRSRCLSCEHRRAVFNENDNEELRARIDVFESAQIFTSLAFEIEHLEKQLNEALEGNMKTSLVSLINDTTIWHYDRNLIGGSTDKDQFHKLIQECAELSDNLCKGRDIRDDIGDIMVVLINIAERNDLTLQECLQVAYDDIKDRKGRMVDGVFIKESDE